MLRGFICCSAFLFRLALVLCQMSLACHAGSDAMTQAVRYDSKDRINGTNTALLQGRLLQVWYQGARVQLRFTQLSEDLDVLQWSWQGYLMGSVSSVRRSGAPTVVARSKKQVDRQSKLNRASIDREHQSPQQEPKSPQQKHVSWLCLSHSDVNFAEPKLYLGFEDEMIRDEWMQGLHSAVETGGTGLLGAQRAWLSAAFRVAADRWLTHGYLWSPFVWSPVPRLTQASREVLAACMPPRWRRPLATPAERLLAALNVDSIVRLAVGTDAA